MNVSNIHNITSDKKLLRQTQFLQLLSSLESELSLGSIEPEDTVQVLRVKTKDSNSTLIARWYFDKEIMKNNYEKVMCKSSKSIFLHKYRLNLLTYEKDYPFLNDTTVEKCIEELKRLLEG